MNNIFPFILETLSSKPEESQKTLMKELRLRYKAENLATNNLKKDFTEALEIGEDLGIFRNANNNVSLLFSLENKKNDVKSPRSKSVAGLNKDKDDLASPSDKVHRSGRRRRGSSNRRQSRSRSRGRNASRRRRRSSRR